MSDFDLVIRGGTLVDGTGGPERTADVAVIDGLIVETGHVSGRGRQEIDADGAIVAPGFVDIHTHYDGQATWDKALQPSSWHGVTTVVMGNCGVGFAPVRPQDHDRLIELMSGVEDIPGVVLDEGVTWEWESFGDYLDTLDRKSYDMDLGTQVPHAALRINAMGDRASAFEAATSEDIDHMVASLEEGIRQGALGFSTSRTLNHKSVKGDVTPAYGAAADELVALCAVMQRLGSGVIQIIDDLENPEADFELIKRLQRSSGRPLSFSLGQMRDEPRKYRRILEMLTAANEDGYTIRAQVAPRPAGQLLGLECTLQPFMMNKKWKELSNLPVKELAKRMADPQVKAEILAAQTNELDPNVIGGTRITRWEAMFPFSEPPNYEPSKDSSVASQAASSGRTPEDVVYDMLVADEGEAMVYMPFTNYADNNLDAVREMLVHEYSIPGLGDGGAHVATISDGSFPTTLLQHWVRDRPEGRIPLPFVVSRQARETAHALGLDDRGVIAPGYKADINVIDMEALTLHRPEMHHDLPAGGSRLLQRADGYRHTIVSGTETYRDGEATGALPGRLIRGPQQAKK
jgi:N-acyl-D-aspartate/D-glutamate deacylase